MNAREHQSLVLANIHAAEARGDYKSAAILRKAWANCLSIQFPPLPDTERVEGSPINSLGDALTKPTVKDYTHG